MDPGCRVHRVRGSLRAGYCIMTSSELYGGLVDYKSGVVADVVASLDSGCGGDGELERDSFL